MYDVPCPMLMCRVLERGSPDHEADGSTSHQSPLVFSILPSPRSASLLIPHMWGILCKKFEKPFGSNLSGKCCGQLHVSAHARNAAVAGWTLER